MHVLTLRLVRFARDENKKSAQQIKQSHPMPRNAWANLMPLATAKEIPGLGKTVCMSHVCGILCKQRSGWIKDLPGTILKQGRGRGMQWAQQSGPLCWTCCVCPSALTDSSIFVCWMKLERAKESR